MKSRVALVVAIVLGAVATLGVYAVIQQAKQESQATQIKDRVAHAKREISAGEVLIEEMIEWKEVPSKFVSKDHIKQVDIKTFFQRKVSSRVQADAPIMQNYFQIDVVDISEKKPSTGYRAVSIPLDYSQGVSGLLRPNQRVDVIAAFKVKPVLVGVQDEEGRVRPPSQAEIDAAWKAYAAQLGGNKLTGNVQGLSPEEYTKDLKTFFSLSALKAEKTEVEVVVTLIQNALVLATDSRTEGGISSYESATLEVTPEQAQMVVYALNNGKLHITLRNQNDPYPVRMAPEYIEKIIGPEAMGGPRTVRSAGGPGE